IYPRSASRSSSARTRRISGRPSSDAAATLIRPFWGLDERGYGRRRSTMEFRILGPLEVLERDSPLDLGGAKQRTLLATLLLDANRPVATERLIDALWEGEPPETAMKAVQGHVSSLRKVLGKDRIETKAGSYLIRASEQELDVERFEALVADERFEEALALWRGPALADFGTDRFAQAEIARLDELRL